MEDRSSSHMETSNPKEKSRWKHRSTLMTILIDCPQEVDYGSFQLGRCVDYGSVVKVDEAQIKYTLNKPLSIRRRSESLGFGPQTSIDKCTSFQVHPFTLSLHVRESRKKAESLEKGESSKVDAVNEEAINVGGEPDSDSESDGDDETVGLGNLFDGDDDDDDDELQLARSKLNLQKKVRKESGIDGLLEVLRQIHGVATNLKKNNSELTVPLDLDDEAGSEDSYESDPGTSSEYVVDEERVTNIGWEQQARPSNRLEWMAMTWPGIHVTPPNVVHTGTSSTPAQKTTARKTSARKPASQKASTSRASASKAPARSKAPTSKAPARSKEPASKAPARSKAPASKQPASKATTSKAPATKSPAKKATASKAPTTKSPAKKATASKAPTTKSPAKKATASKLDMIRRGLNQGKGRKRWSARRRKDGNEWQMGYSASSYK
ncbi:hypothetical protein ACFE04_027492 [Oxalis oulophora]